MKVKRAIVIEEKRPGEFAHTLIDKLWAAFDGPHGAVIHYKDSGRPFEKDDFVGLLIGPVERVLREDS